MKMDEKYFEGKIEQLNEFEDFYFYSEAHATLIEKPEVKAILHQIAADAFEAGAKAQKVAIELAVEKEFGLWFGTNPGEFKGMFADVESAINSATVKWEVPGE